MSTHKVFLSYHHSNDQIYKDALVRYNSLTYTFIDKSVENGDIDDTLSDEQIRIKIRDEFLADSTVTIVLVGTETAHRKHVDWEIYSSMRDSPKNKKSGIIVVLLPTLPPFPPGLVIAPHGQAEKSLYPLRHGWTPLRTRDEILTNGGEYIPARIVDSLVSGATISVTTWDEIRRPGVLSTLIELAHTGRDSCTYDLTRPMREHNS